LRWRLWKLETLGTLGMTLVTVLMTTLDWNSLVSLGLFESNYALVTIVTSLYWQFDSAERNKGVLS